MSKYPDLRKIVLRVNLVNSQLDPVPKECM